jgi:hypothetical protein
MEAKRSTQGRLLCVALACASQSLAGCSSENYGADEGDTGVSRHEVVWNDSVFEYYAIAPSNKFSANSTAILTRSTKVTGCNTS